MLFRAGLDAALADRLELGAATGIERGGDRLPARLVRNAPGLDAATRSYTAFLEVEGAAPPARVGGAVALPDRVAARGARVPLAALTRGPRSTWALPTVEGGEADAVLALVTAEIEVALRERAEVDSLVSSSATGVSIMRVELLETQVEERIEQIRSE